MSRDQRYGPAPLPQIEVSRITKEIRKSLDEVYKDAAIANPLMQSESLTLHWMQRALDAEDKLTIIKAACDAARRELCEAKEWYEPNPFYESYSGGAQGQRHSKEEYALKRGWSYLYEDEVP